MHTAPDLRDHLDRLRRGHTILRALRLRELCTLTADESRAQYDALVRLWEAQRAALGAALDRRAIGDRVALRRRLAGRR